MLIRRTWSCLLSVAGVVVRRRWTCICIQGFLLGGVCPRLVCLPGEFGEEVFHIVEYKSPVFRVGRS